MTVEGKAGTTPRDRFAEVLVVAVVVVALLVGWGVKAGAESHAVDIRIQGFQARYGHNWIRKEPTAPDVLEIVDPGSGGRFPTTITVKELQSAGSNADVAQLLNQVRLSEKELYRSIQGETIEWRGRETYRNDFAYVYVSPDLLHPNVPVVLHGVDYVFQHGSTTYVITVLADEGVYDEAMVEFERFLESVTPG